VGSLEKRVERVVQELGLRPHEALAEVRRIDHTRSHFISTYFRRQIDDPTQYDMVFSTDRVSVEEAAQLIAHLVQSPNFRAPQASKLKELRHDVLG
jgi:cytidylate kinase